MDLEASLNSRHHDFWSISKKGTVSYQWSSWEDFDAYMKDTLWWTNIAMENGHL